MKCVLNTNPDLRYRGKDIRVHPWFKIHQPICKKEGIIVGVNKIEVRRLVLIFNRQILH
jgi:hypothetical protein